MGVNPVGNQKYFTFDGESSKTYHTHITGTGVFNAPVRSVEMVSIPGRNGEFPLDAGRFDNVELTYEASIVADSVAEFSQAVSDLRNWLCSKVGYCRLEDDYNPNEYRMAVYRSGLEVEPFQATSGTFELVFDCKPQRFLKSGETAVSVTSGDTITNPTRFEASPLLEVEGYGEIALGNHAINLYDIPYGIMQILPQERELADSEGGNPLVRWPFPENRTNNGDPIFIYAPTFELIFESTKMLSNVVVSSQSNGSAIATCSGLNGNVRFIENDESFLQTGAEQSLISSATLVFTATDNTTSTLNLTFKVKYSPHASPDYGTLELSITQNDGGGFVKSATLGHIYMSINGLVANSSISGLGHPTYIDLDIGEAYMIKDGEIIGLNSTVVFPSDLPTLQSGANTITYDNTFTSVDIVPRWWKV